MVRVGGNPALAANRRSARVPDNNCLEICAAPCATSPLVRGSLASRIVLAAMTLAVVLA